MRQSATDMKGIAVAGSILVDRINEISRYPERSELTKISRVTLATGGCVPNVAIDLKRLDPTLPVYAIGRVGRDGDGDFAVSVLESESVDVSGIVRSDEKTSFTEVMSEVGGQRTFFTYPGASAEFSDGDVTLDPDAYSIFHLGYFLLLDRIDAGDGEKLLRRASEAGIETSIDLVSENSDRYSIVKPVLPLVDNLIINELEAGKIVGIEPKEENIEKIAEALMALGVRRRVVIHMTAAAYILSKDGLSVLPSFALPKDYIKGTTGAGDAFCAGALLAISRGLSDREVLEYGQVAALGALRAADAVSGMAALDELQVISKNFKRI